MNGSSPDLDRLRPEADNCESMFEIFEEDGI
jgi:hypothetical protein